MFWNHGHEKWISGRNKRKAMAKILPAIPKEFAK